MSILKLLCICLPDCNIPALLYRLHDTSLLWYTNSILYCLLHALIKTVKSIITAVSHIVLTSGSPSTMLQDSSAQILLLTWSQIVIGKYSVPLIGVWNGRC